jgi:methylthioribose-1-phosphate isomerase
MRLETVAWTKGKIRLIDQTRLPDSFTYIYCRDVKTLWKAIRKLEVRGAPAIGIAAGFGVALAAQQSKATTLKAFEKTVMHTISYLGTARPTAINLFWALERMRNVFYANRNTTIPAMKKVLLNEAQAIFQEDRRMCRSMASFGARLVASGDTILTLCNAGALATADYGTALGVVYKAKAQGKKITVYACETRPLLQGARLTTWELLKRGIKVTLICDNMAATLMQQKKIDKVFVGADRIAANGDTANKIGTYNLAVLAKHHNVPLYVVAPSSSVDLALASGGGIPIEERSGDEVRHVLGTTIAPRQVNVYNPAFDVTPHKLITAIVTEAGIARRPYSTTLKRLIRT